MTISACQVVSSNTLLQEKKSVVRKQKSVHINACETSSQLGFRVFLENHQASLAHHCTVTLESIPSFAMSYKTNGIQIMAIFNQSEREIK